MDQRVGRFFHTLLVHQLFFIQLFTGTQTRIDHGNIHIRLKTGKLDQVTGKGIDFYRNTHIQHEDLTAPGISSGLHNQADRLRDGHKIADNIGVCNRHRAALGNLLFEQRNDRTIAAQNVAETHSHKLCLERLADHCLRNTLLLVHLVGKEHRQIFCRAFFHRPIKALNDHFAQALAGAHNVGGVDRLIGADQYEALTTIDHSRIGSFICTNYIVFNGFTGTCLHQRHMLMGCCVVDYIRPVCRKKAGQTAAIPHGTNQNLQIQLRIIFLQFLLNVVGIVLINVKDNQLLGVVGCNLPAQLAADGSTATGDQNGLAANEPGDLIHIDPNGISSQKILHRDLAHIFQSSVLRYQLLHARQCLDLAAGFFALIQDLPLLLAGGAGNSK